jgi:NAD(P)-dependent dehydrogenase (short-subunit alcohol dehydrogenase family)
MNSEPVVAITDVLPIGRATARLLAHRGSRIALYHSTLQMSHAEALVQEFGADRVYAHAIASDAWQSLADAIDATAAVFGTAPQHAVIWCDRWDAGGGGPLHVGGWNDQGHFQRTLAANLEATYRTLRAVLPAMVAARRGSVVMIGSRMAESPEDSEGAAVHGAAKAAALALARTAAREVADHDVRVNSILITVPDAPETQTALRGLGPRSWCCPDDVAKLVAFLLSDDARAVTGATIPMFGRI